MLRLPSDNGVLVYIPGEGEPLRELLPLAIRFVAERGVLYKIGDGSCFVYWLRDGEERPNQTFWLMSFYAAVPILAATRPKKDAWRRKPGALTRPAQPIHQMETKSRSRILPGCKLSWPVGKYPVESLSKEEARLRHPDCEFIAVFSIVDEDGDRRSAIFVWRREEDASEEDPAAMYWLKQLTKRSLG